MTGKFLIGTAAVMALAMTGCGGSGDQGGRGSLQPPAGTIVEYATPTANSLPSGITTGPDGNIWIVESAAVNNIAKVTISGVIKEYPLPTSTRVASNIVSGPDGNLWYTDIANNLGQVTTSGKVTTFVAPSGSIAVGSDNNLWVAETNGGSVDVYSTAGAKLHTFASGTNPAGLQVDAIALGPDGDVWYDTFSGENVVKMADDGSPSEFTLSTIAPSNTMRGITQGPDGNIWFCGEESNLICRLTPTGTLTTFTVPTADAKPYGIAKGSDGNLWFTELLGNKIGRITPSGVITEFPIPTANANPFEITTGPDGNVWFTELGASKVAKIYPF